MRFSVYLFLRVIKTKMKLGIICCIESINNSHIDSIDKICRNVWEVPSTVRFFNIHSETVFNTDVMNWANLYFGCKFMPEVPKSISSPTFVSPRASNHNMLDNHSSSISSTISSTLSPASSSTLSRSLSTSRLAEISSSVMSPRLSRSSSSSPSPSPRPSNSSPRLFSSQRKFAKSCLEYLQDMADNCTHIVIIGIYEQSNTLVKMFPLARIILLVN